MTDAHPESANEQTIQLDNLVEAIRRLEAKADTRKPAAKPRKPLASTEAYVAIVVAVCLLVAFIAYLYYTH